MGGETEKTAPFPARRRTKRGAEPVGTGRGAELGGVVTVLCAG